MGRQQQLCRGSLRALPRWRGAASGLAEVLRDLAGARADVAHGPILKELEQIAQAPRQAIAPAESVQTEKQAAVSRLIQIYMNRGHLLAKLDPLGLTLRPRPRVMDLERLDLTDADQDAEFHTSSRVEGVPRRAKLRDIVALLNKIFAGPIGAEFAHVSDTDERLWLQDQFMQGRLQQKFTNEERINILKQLTAAEGLERYLHTKYVGRSASRWKVAMR